MIKLKHKRLAVDIDGTLFEDNGNINNLTDLIPKANASKVTKKLKQKGYEILIYTCRPDYHRKYLEEQLNKNKINFDYILFYTKPRVDAYIDDKAINFSTWEQIERDIELIERQNLGLEQPFSSFEKVLQKEKIAPISKYKNKAVVDIGCGDGSVFNNTKFKNVYGVEPNALAANLCKQVPNYKQIYSCILEVNWKKCELITLLGVLEHLNNNEIQETLSLISRQQKPVFITVPNAESFHRYYGVKLKCIKSIYELQQNDLSIGHTQYFNKESLMDVIENFFSVTQFVFETGTLGFKMLPNKQMEQFPNHKELFSTAKQLNLIGKNNYYGAELYCLITPKSL